MSASIGVSDLTILGDVQVLASNATYQVANVSGVAGGLIGIGAHLANAGANSTTTSTIANGVTGTIGGTLAVDAVGRDETYAHALAGSGGMYAGAAAVATASNQSSTKAEIGAGSASKAFDANAISLSAVHTALFNGTADSINAAVVGMSGSQVEHSVDSTVEAAIQGGANLRTYDLVVRAENLVNKPSLSGGFNAAAGSGGVAGGSAASSVSDIALDTYATIGSNAKVAVIGDIFNPGRTDFSAVNSIAASDKVKLDAGGVIAIAGSESRIRVNQSNAEVRMQGGATLDSVGTVNLGAQALISMRAPIQRRMAQPPLLRGPPKLPSIRVTE